MTDPTATTGQSLSRSSDLALIATFAALIAVCAILPAINGANASVPFTLQMFGIFLTGAVLGALRAGLAVVLYLAIGTAGLPIFSGGAAGPGVWTGASGGYLLSFPVAAFVVGLVAQLTARRSPRMLLAALCIAVVAVTVIVVAGLGTLGMARALGISWPEAWAFATPFLLPDIAKGIVAAVIAMAVHRAFPQILRG